MLLRVYGSKKLVYVSGWKRYFSRHTSNEEYRDDKCWKCHSLLLKGSLFCNIEPCQVAQHLNPIDVNYFDLFDIPRNEVKLTNMKKLDANFKELQMKLHPDKFTLKSLEEQTASANTSSLINQVGIPKYFFKKLKSLTILIYMYKGLSNTKKSTASSCVHSGFTWNPHFG